VTGTVLHLDTDAWLPVTYTDSRARKVSLTTLFTDAHLIAGLNLQSPPGYSSLLRILTALTYRITALCDPEVPVEVWHDERTRIMVQGRFAPTAAREYFECWHHRFDLFDEQRPWRQDPRLRTECDAPAGLTTLLADRPSGKNPAWFSTFNDRNPGTASPALAVEHMLIRQAYGPLGRCQARETLDGHRSADFTYVGAQRARVSFHPVGHTMFDTLMAHLVPAITFPEAEVASDLADWETPTLAVTLGVKPPPSGFVSLLANDHGHAVLLESAPHPQDPAAPPVITDGYLTWRYADKATGNAIGFDPYLSYQNTAAGPKPRMADAGRDLWRDLPALLATPGAPRVGGGYAPPVVMRALPGLPDTVLADLRIASYGFVQHGFQPKDADWTSGVSPAILSALAENPDDPTAGMYPAAVTEWVHAADEELTVLRGALYRTFLQARAVKPKSELAAAWGDHAAPLFWQKARDQFDAAFLAAGSGAEFAALAATVNDGLREITLSVFDDVTRGVHDPRGVWAVAKCRPRRHRATLRTEQGAHTP